ncbi:MAG: hypothetical protein HYU56_02460 [Candidatus Aenigmarchaeota archaeon]|nr:hypothetical protein [Candidatus Aenigmarchaeota archaeon]
MITKRYIEDHIRSLGSRHEDDLMTAAMSAYEAGERIAKRDFSQEVIEKPDQHVSYHAAITEADELSQEIIFNEAEKYLPGVRHIGEEADKEKERFQKFADRIISEADYLEVIPKGKVVISDSLDGTAQYAMKTGQWSNSVGVWNKMQATAAAVYGPRCNFRETGSGLLVMAAEDTPAYMITNNGMEQARVAVAPDARKRFFAHYGVDTPFLAPSEFMRSYAGKNWASNTYGSCALGLALVSTGDSHVFYQPEHRVWDWAAGKLLVERAGGHMLMYEVGKKLREMGIDADFDVRKTDRMQPYHFSPANKPLGFVAGYSREVAEEVFRELEQGWASRHMRR